MYLNGEIDRVYPNGLISYVGSETRADGVPIGSLEEQHGEGGNSASDNDSGGEEEEGVFFGKGFDDNTSDSGKSDDFGETSHDDYDEIMANDEGSKKPAATKKEATAEDTKRPNSFSKIDVATLNDASAIAYKFPRFSACRQSIVELKKNQTLYLPAGWFHEVTSQDETKGSYHTALNYWFHPPDSLDRFEQPYKDRRFWREEAKQRQHK